MHKHLSSGADNVSGEGALSHCGSGWDQTLLPPAPHANGNSAARQARTFWNVKAG